MGKLVSIILIFFITSCATTQPIEQEYAKAWLAEDNVLHYDGGLEREAMDRLFQLYSQAPKKPTSLQINSPGGNVDLGIEFGHWVFDNQLSVIVENLCASSCANYIFPAAKQKLLKRHSILIWHGGSMQGDASENIMRGDSYAIKWRMKEWRFYNKVDVNPMLNVYGSKRKIPIKWYQYPLGWLGLWKSSFIGFDYSLEDMQKFGIKNIILVDGVWDWRLSHKNKDTIKKQVLRVKVTQKDLSQPF